jgi:demethylmenaquinone methyltransferase / 2-methoxy-6-polyprenyl-1,4-benzoquinol methylase
MRLADSQQPSTIRSMFAGIARRYDLANSVMTVGLHHRWRRCAAALCDLHPGGQAIDLACGTGDFALLLARAAGPSGMVVGVDFCEELLVIAREKANTSNASIEFVNADILALPLADGSFDAATIGFGVRNVRDVSASIREMARVVRSGGRVVILETGQPANRLLRALVAGLGRAYIRAVGMLVTRDVRAYAYLHASSQRFPSGPQFVELMRSVGCFSEIESQSQSCGVAWIYVGTVR